MLSIAITIQKALLDNKLMVDQALTYNRFGKFESLSRLWNITNERLLACVEVAVS
jgi:hypothetical protein